MNTNEIISDEQIDEAWGNANFGDVSKRDVIGNSLLKFACDYCTGNTIQCICKELGLLSNNYRISKKGKKYLYAHYSNNLSV